MSRTTDPNAELRAITSSDDPPIDELLDRYGRGLNIGSPLVLRLAEQAMRRVVERMEPGKTPLDGIASMTTETLREFMAVYLLGVDSGIRLMLAERDKANAENVRPIRPEAS